MDALPHEVMVMVLQRLPLPERLHSHALVQRRWAAAAAAATSNIELRIGRAQQQKQLRVWLKKHGRHLTSLNLSWGQLRLNNAPVLEHERLRCPQLLELRLRDMQVQLSGVLRACPGLQLLHLVQCQVEYPSLDAAALVRATSLRSLAVTYSYHSDVGDLRLNGSLVSQFTYLTSLECMGCHGQTPAVQHLAVLTNLRSLRLSPIDDGPDAFAHLSQLQQLTSLQLRRAKFGCRTFPWLAQLTGLQCLGLEWCREVSVVMLPRLPVATLQHISPTQCDFALGHTSIPSTAENSENITAALLGRLSMYGSLRHLSLRSTLTALAPDPSAYSAVTASSQLTSLDLCGCKLPPGVCQWLFPPGRLLPELVELHLGLYFQADGADMERLVCSCPALQTLYWPGSHDGDAFAALQRLPRLQKLEVGDISSVEAAQELAKVAGLTRLSAERVTQAVCQQLTRLTNLCGFEACLLLPDTWSARPTNTASWLRMTNQAPFGSPPDVWCQLVDGFGTGDRQHEQ